VPLKLTRNIIHFFCTVEQDIESSGLLSGGSNDRTIQHATRYYLSAHPISYVRGQHLRCWRMADDGTVRSLRSRGPMSAQTTNCHGHTL
jgi:hypothetical protein